MPGTWTSLVNQPAFNTSTMILLTDGRIMVQEEGTPNWHALKPDPTGSYIGGQWSTLKSMSFWRRYYSSGVMKDGRVFLCGGEQSGDANGANGEDSNKGEIYDPVQDKWTPVATPSWTQVGDAASCVLPDGRIIVGALLSGDCIIYNPSSNSWAPTGRQSGRTNEQTWILLPDNTIVTPQCFPPYGSQKYVISSGVWQDEGPVPVTIVDPDVSEMGPGILLYNGTVIFFGAANSGGHGKTVLYNRPATPTGRGTWTAGPDIPVVGGQPMVCNDCPAALLPNGKVLFTAANYVQKAWGSPVLFFEYDPSTNTIAQAPTPSNNGKFPYPGPQNAGIYWSRLMLLPNGQVLFSASSNDIQVYQPDGGPQDAWRPTIKSVTPHGGSHPDYYLVQGTQLNGLSQANCYGDDCYPATNYPLAQLTNTATHQVLYCRTHDFSTMAVATGSTLQSCRFTPGSLPPGTYDLRIVANGIASHPVSLGYHAKPTKPPAQAPIGLDVEEVANAGAEAASPADDWRLDEIRATLRSLENSVARINLIIQASALPPIGEGTATQAGVNQLRKDEGEDGEHDDAADDGGAKRAGDKPSRSKKKDK